MVSTALFTTRTRGIGSAADRHPLQLGVAHRHRRQNVRQQAGKRDRKAILRCVAAVVAGRDVSDGVCFGVGGCVEQRLPQLPNRRPRW